MCAQDDRSAGASREGSRVLRAVRHARPYACKTVGICAHIIWRSSTSTRVGDRRDGRTRRACARRDAIRNCHGA